MTPDIAKYRRGRVTAAAGHGKTQLVVTTLRAQSDGLPALVLTHTNAGVRALRRRLSAQKVPRSHYRLETIDAFMMLLIRCFPARSGLQFDSSATNISYPKVRRAAAQLVENGSLDRVLPLNYSRALIDEYQDCVVDQHRFALGLARTLPTVVMGDPLQGIFGFGGNQIPPWDRVVGVDFDEHACLDTPWRWRNAGNDELGDWIWKVRGRLLRGESVQLEGRPSCVHHRPCALGNGGRDVRIEAARCRHRGKDESLLVIGDSRDEASRLAMARSVSGLTPVEPVDLRRSLIAFTSTLALGDEELLQTVLGFASSVMTGVKAPEVRRRALSLQKGKAKNPPSEVESRAVDLLDAPSHLRVKRLLMACRAQTGVRLFRPRILQLALEALDDVIRERYATLEEAGIAARDRSRRRHHEAPQCGIGSTLLLKGLECDHVVILDADRLQEKDLYVALTRARQSITICSASETIGPLLS